MPVILLLERSLSGLPRWDELFGKRQEFLTGYSFSKPRPGFRPIKATMSPGQRSSYLWKTSHSQALSSKCSLRRVCSVGQQHWPERRAHEKCRVLGLTPDPPNQNLHFTNSSGDFYAHLKF